MSLALLDGPDRIIQTLLVAKGWCADPTAFVGGGTRLGSWPAYYSAEPDAPAEVVAVWETEPRVSGRSMIDGERWLHRGIMLKVRSNTHSAGMSKVQDLSQKLSEEVRKYQVVIEGRTYLISNVSIVSGPFNVGTGVPSDRRSVFTLNAVCAVDRLA